MPATTERQLDTVIFRKYTDGEIVALFPNIPCDEYGYDVLSYMHIGQHSGADYGLVIKNTTPATFEEFRALKDELTERGYNLSIRQRRSRN